MSFAPHPASRNRLALQGSLLVAAALSLTLASPLWVLALGPILLGVPHVLSDLRYLWIRPGAHKSAALNLGVAAPLVAVSVTAQPGWGLAAVVAAAVVTPGPTGRRAGVMALAGAGLVGAVVRPDMATLAMAHAHNLIGLVLWWVWRPRLGRLEGLPLLIFAGGCALLLTGVFDGAVLGRPAGAGALGGLGLPTHLATLAPGLGRELGARVVLVFAFAQLVHYVVWMWLVPRDAGSLEVPGGFATTLRGLRAEAGDVVVALTLAAATGLAVWAAFDLFGARAGYLRAVLFHAHLEVAAAALLWVRGTRPVAVAAFA